MVSLYMHIDGARRHSGPTCPPTQAYRVWPPTQHDLMGAPGLWYVNPWHVAHRCTHPPDICVGKTTLAMLIERHAKNARFVSFSATPGAGTAEAFRKVIEQARNDHRLLHRRTILFIDEIHRLNKSQQVVITRSRVSTVVTRRGEGHFTACHRTWHDDVGGCYDGKPVLSAEFGSTKSNHRVYLVEAFL